ncbi:MAG TPA: hypothetical protein VHM70_30230 [Polyangiaceae bacterium]|nr:hypothetical protein [Polyangiaceae bacterium]
MLATGAAGASPDAGLVAPAGDGDADACVDGEDGVDLGAAEPADPAGEGTGVVELAADAAGAFAVAGRDVLAAVAVLAFAAAGALFAGASA